MSARMAAIAMNAITVWLRTAKHSTVRAAAIRVVASQACPAATVVTYRARLSPYCALKVTGPGSSVWRWKKPVTAEEIVRTAAEAEATSSALPYSDLSDERSE